MVKRFLANKATVCLMFFSFSFCLYTVPANTAGLAPTVGSIKIILDTDIGDDIDDAYAVALICSLPEARLIGVTTTFGQTDKRALIAAKLLEKAGRRDVPVFSGIAGEQKVGRQLEWAKDYKLLAKKTVGALEFMRAEILKAPGQITLVGIGALANIGALLEKYPDVRSKIKQIVIMGGAVYTGYAANSKPEPEWNIRCDAKAAKRVYESGVPLIMAGLEVTAMMQLDVERQKKIYARGTGLTDSLAALTMLWGGGTPTLFDPVAVAWALGHPFADSEQKKVVVENDGLTRIVEGTPNCTVLIHPRKEEFLNWFVDVVSRK